MSNVTIADNFPLLNGILRPPEGRSKPRNMTIHIEPCHTLYKCRIQNQQIIIIADPEEIHWKKRFPRFSLCTYVYNVEEAWVGT